MRKNHVTRPRGRKDNRKLSFAHSLPSMSSSRSALSGAQAANEILIKGLILAIIGLVLLIAPYFMHATPLRDMFVSAYLAGWFALVLGLAFVGQFLVRRRKAQQAQAQAEARAAAAKPSKKR